MKVLTKYTKKLAPVVLALALVTAVTTPAYAAAITSLSLNPSDSRASTAATHLITMSTSATALLCVQITYSTNADKTGAAPASGTANTPAGTFYTAWTGFTGATTGGGASPLVVKWTKASSAVVPNVTSGATLSVAGLTNGATPGSYYVTVETFTDAACTAAVDSGVAAWAITNGTTVSAIVDPTLTFSVADNVSACNGVAIAGTTSGSGTAVSLGRVTTANLPFRSQNLIVSTNANSGYTVYARYNGAMTGTPGSIADWTGTNATPTATWAAGTEAFGYTTSDATLGTGTANRFTNGGAKFAKLTTGNLEVSYAATGPLSNDTNCIGYQMGAAGTTKAGSYSTTVIYTAVPVF